MVMRWSFSVEYYCLYFTLWNTGLLRGASAISEFLFSLDGLLVQWRVFLNLNKNKFPIPKFRPLLFDESLFPCLIIGVGKTHSFNDFLFLEKKLRRLISSSSVITPFILFLLSYQRVLPTASLFPSLPPFPPELWKNSTGPSALSNWIVLIALFAVGKSFNISFSPQDITFLATWPSSLLHCD